MESARFLTVADSQMTSSSVPMSLPTMAQKLWSLLDARSRRNTGLMMAALVVATILEFAGIALFVPVIALTVNSESAASIPGLNEMFAALDLTTIGVQVVFMSGALMVLYVIKNAILAGVTWMMARIPLDTRAALGETVMRGYLHRPYEAHLAQNSSEIMRNMTVSISTLVDRGIRGMMTVVTESCLLIAAFAVVLLLEPIITLIVATMCVGLMGGLLFFVRRRIVSWTEVCQEESARLVKAINEALDAFRELKLSGQGNAHARRVRDINLAALPFHTRILFFGQVPRIAGEVALIASAFVVVVVIVLVEGRPPEAAAITLGIFVGAGLRLLPSANRIVDAIVHLRSCAVIFSAIENDIAPQGDQARPESKRSSNDKNANLDLATLMFEDVTYTYPGAAVPSLRGVSVSIRPGELVCLAGPSGAGKSTFADLALGLIDPESGRVLGEGRDIRDNRDDWWRHVGYVPQSVVMFDQSLADNIAFGRDAPSDATTAKILDACERSRLSDHLAQLPDGLDTRMGERGAWLSGGQRQRVGVARALYGQPHVLVLDEPTSALDGETSRRVLESLRATRGTRTTLVISHSAEAMQMCDRVLLLKDGRLVGDGHHRELAVSNPDFNQFVATLAHDDDPAEADAVAHD